MTNKQTCEGLDCAWCMALDCPKEKKEIIIDGVDVSNCEKQHHKGCTAYDFTQCGNNPNCYKNE